MKRFAVDVSILYGNIDQLKNTAYGTLILEVSGTEQALLQANAYLESKHVKAEVIGYES